MSLPFLARWLPAIAFVVLAGCGGGGGGGEPAAAGPAAPQAESAPAAGFGVVFDPPLLKATFTELGQSDGDRRPPGAQVTVHFANPPDGQVFVVIAQDRPVLSGLILSLESTADGYTAYLPFSTEITAGTYTGEIKLLLCLDAACQSQYPGSGAALPYALTVTPGVHLTVTVNGRQVDARHVQTRAGDQLRVVADRPVQWLVHHIGGGFASKIQETETTWAGTSEYGVAAHGMVGDFTLDALMILPPSAPPQLLHAALEVQVTE